MRTFAGLGMLLVLAVAVAPGFADSLTVTLVSITPTVSHGEQSTLVIQTQPGAACSGEITLQKAGGGKPGGQGNNPSGGRLPERQANAQGQVTWMWKTIGTAGHRNVRVTCKSGDQTASLDTGFDVGG